MQHKLLHPSRIFTLFKYAVYAALLANLWLFFREDFGAAQVWGGSGISALRLIAVFAQTIDTFAWLSLLLLFELETSFLPDSALQHPALKRTLHGARVLCALIILNSLAGYVGKVVNYLDASTFAGDACELVGSDWSLLEAHDEFVPLDSDNCGDVGTAFQLPDSKVLGTAEVLSGAKRLAWVDVINALAWVMVVVLLEFDVRMQLRGGLSGAVLRVSVALKILTYAVLLIAAVYWGFAGTFLDFWDAFLWLVAFVFIEMNLFQWQEEGERLSHQVVLRGD